MSRIPLPLAAAILLLGGMALLFVSEWTVLQLIAVFTMIGGIACGVFAIATPEYLGRDTDPAETPGGLEDQP